MNIDASKIIAWRRHLHQWPEISTEEKETAAFLSAELRKMGYRVQEKVYGYGLLGVLPGDPAKKTVALRCDMDALAIQELNDVPYRSKRDGVMHACGHDGHMAMVLAAAQALALDPPAGTVKIICQPSEENPPGGAGGLIAAGILEDPAVDAVFGCHVSNEYPAGSIAVINGYMMAIADDFYITLKGRGGHGAMPHQNIDTINMAAEIITAFQHIVSREISAFEPLVLSFGTISGGTTHNIMPDEVKLSGTVRCYDFKTRDYALDKMYHILNGITSLWGGSYEMNYVQGYPSLRNDNAMVGHIRRTAAAIPGLQVREMAHPMMISEDFSYYALHKPAAFFLVGTGSETYQMPWHNASFDLDERGLFYGATVLAHAAAAIAAEDIGRQEQ